MEIVIALDIGKTKTGIAKSDPMGILIKPLKTVLTSNLLSELETISQEFNIPKIVIGNPINTGFGNKDSLSLIETESNRIKSSFPQAEIVFINESFTSREAETILKEKGIKIQKNNKELLDMYAAAILLEEYFQADTQKNT